MLNTSPQCIMFIGMTHTPWLANFNEFIFWTCPSGFDWAIIRFSMLFIVNYFHFNEYQSSTNMAAYTQKHSLEYLPQYMGFTWETHWDHSFVFPVCQKVVWPHFYFIYCRDLLWGPRGEIKKDGTSLTLYRVWQMICSWLFLSVHQCPTMHSAPEMFWGCLTIVSFYNWV